LQNDPIFVLDEYNHFLLFGAIMDDGWRLTVRKAKTYAFACLADVIAYFPMIKSVFIKHLEIFIPYGNGID
jgi:hypothetical protein